jgi:predicted AlkP superfamily pyrophosphatase or phosphodiesterase
MEIVSYATPSWKARIFFLGMLVFISTDALAAHVLINIWDGADIAVVRDMYKNNLLPNLKALGRLNQVTSILPCYGKSCQSGATRDQHATMITGVDASKHHIWNNGQAFPPITLNPIPKGLTIYEKLRESIPDIKLAQIGKCRLFGKDTIKNAIPALDFVKDCPDSTSGLCPNGPCMTTPEATNHVLALVQKWSNQANWLIFVNFIDPDVTGHNHGVQSTDYRGSLANNDKLLGDMINAIPYDTEVFVLSDHGFGTINLDTGASRSYQHDAHTPGGILVRRRLNTRQDLYMDQLADIWLRIFMPPQK